MCFWLYNLVIIILLVFIIYIHTAINRKRNNIEQFANDEFRNTVGTMVPTTFATGFAYSKPDLKFVLNSENLYIEDSNIWSSKLATYWLFMNQPNIEARKQTKLVELQNKYRNSGIQTITDTEKKNTSSTIEMNINSLKTTKPEMYHYLKYWGSRFKLAKGATWLEGGMPHTHENMIILNPSSFTSSGFQFSTFLHEIAHIHQRKYPQDWDELIWQWGFLHYNFLDSPSSGLENILVRNRTNPDGLDINYLWKDPSSGKYYWIGAIYSTITPTSLTDGVQYLACEMTTDNANVFRYTGTTINLAQFDSFINFFGVSNNHYHPNEIIAEYMTKYLADDELPNKGYDLFKTYMKIFIWPKYEEEN